MQSLAQEVVTILEDKKAENVVCIDVSDREYLVDCVVIATAMVGKHSFALLDHLCDHRPVGAAAVDLAAQQVAGAQVHKAVVLDDVCALRALAAARPAQHKHNVGLVLCCCHACSVPAACLVLPQSFVPSDLTIKGTKKGLPTRQHPPL